MNNVPIPRPEYPNPQFARENWINLNGEWEFEKDPGDSGEARGLPKAEALSGRIVVPFCMESELSGVGDKDFCAAVWYRRAVTLPEGFAEAGKRVFLHIGACDYRTTVYVNGVTDPAAYANPLPAGLVLTGIVVSVSVTALMLALTIRLYARYHTLDLDKIYMMAKDEQEERR